MHIHYGWPFLSDPGHPVLSAIWAVAIHGVICATAVAPLIWCSDDRIRNTVFAFVGGSAIDLDHFVAAGNLNLQAIETMGSRPDTHSLLFVAALALVALALTRRLLIAWAVFAVNVAHLLFDAAGGGVHVFYPSTALDGLPWLVCPIGTLLLCAASAAIVGTRPRPQAHAHAEIARRDALEAG